VRHFEVRRLPWRDDIAGSKRGRRLREREDKGNRRGTKRER